MENYNDEDYHLWLLIMVYNRVYKAVVFYKDTTTRADSRADNIQRLTSTIDN